MIPITGSVGQGGKNYPADVRVVQQGLNLVPLARGGPGTQLVEDSMIGPLTIAAISGFQQRCFGWADGRIDAAGQTLTKLVEVAQEIIRQADVLRPIIRAQLARILGGDKAEVVVAQLALLSPFRLAVLAVALAEMVPTPYGAVNDFRTVPAVNPATKQTMDARFGWQRLEEYTRKGFPSLSPTTKESELEFYRGLMTKNERINMGSKTGAPNPYHWCGVFCAWVYLQQDRLTPFVPAGKSLKRVVWTPGRLGMPASKLSYMRMNWPGQVKPGDICNIVADSHHFMILTPAVKGKFLTINANSTYKGNVVMERDINLITGWYSANDFLA